jgi:hypothetical protein
MAAHGYGSMMLSARFLAPRLSRIFHVHQDTHRLTLFFSAPEPVGAVAPAPSTAASAQATATEAPKEAETNPTDTSAAPAPTLDLPALPNNKPAAGMSATSGPMFEVPNFGEEKAANTAAPVAQAEQFAAPAPSAAPTAATTPAAPVDKQ